MDPRSRLGKTDVAAGFKSLFQKSPLKSRAVHGATIYDVVLPINTQYGAKPRHSRENGNLEAGVPIGFEFMKQALETRRYGMEIRGAVKTNWHYTSMTAMESHAAHRIVGVRNAEFLLMYDGPR